MKEWHFNTLFFVGVGGALFLLIGPEFGLDVNNNPTALAGVGSILTYILTQRKALTTKKPERKRRRKDDDHEPYESPYDDHEELGDDK